MQEETLVDVLTVRETLIYSASLRTTKSRKEIESSVKAVLTELGLSHVADSQIGSVKTFRGISGGEKKRVSIGMELMACPPVLLLDEPTTGLDAAAAASVMQILRNLVENRGTVVICTLHQPRTEIFEKLGKVLLLRSLDACVAANSNVVVCATPHRLKNMLSNCSAASNPSFASFAGIVNNKEAPLESQTGTNVADILLDLVVAGFAFDGDAFCENGTPVDGDHGSANRVDINEFPTRRESFEVEEIGMVDQNADGDAQRNACNACCFTLVKLSMY